MVDRDTREHGILKGRGKLILQEDCTERSKERGMNHWFWQATDHSCGVVWVRD